MLIDELRHDLVQGPDGMVEGWLITCTFTDSEMADILAAYDPASSTSPAVTICRPITREMLDAVLAAQSQVT